jgi:D-alanine-D-alanine ligase
MGGRSSEHEVSLASARSVLEALDPARYDVRPIEISRDGRFDDPDPFRDVDVAFPVLHGPYGEDGTIQGMLEVAGVAYVGSGVAASALCMDKDLFKAVLRDKGIPVPASLTIRRGDSEAVENPFGFPVVVKPARLGSSVGITIARTAAELERGIGLAFEHDEKILLEEHVSGIEVECGVLGNEHPVPSLPGEIVLTASDWYDYSAKYDEGGMELVIPARISDTTSARVQELALWSFAACDCEGMARVDFFVREDGEVIVSELNTIPGFTATSVYAKLFEASGTPYRQLVDRLVELALSRRERRASLRY